MERQGNPWKSMGIPYRNSWKLTEAHSLMEFLAAPPLLHISRLLLIGLIDFLPGLSDDSLKTTDIQPEGLAAGNMDIAATFIIGGFRGGGRSFCDR